MVAFHALTGKQLQGLRLTDIVDGRLALDGRVIPLAGPVRVRLAAWCDHRARTWPASINPHLFVTRRTAPRLIPVALNSPGRRRPSNLRRCERTASSRRSTPVAATYAASAICSALPSTLPCATQPPSATPTWPTTRPRGPVRSRSEEHTSELQSRENLVCR